MYVYLFILIYMYMRISVRSIPLGTNENSISYNLIRIILARWLHKLKVDKNIIFPDTPQNTTLIVYLQFQIWW